MAWEYFNIVLYVGSHDALAAQIRKKFCRVDRMIARSLDTLKNLTQISGVGKWLIAKLLDSGVFLFLSN